MRMRSWPSKRASPVRLRIRPMTARNVVVLPTPLRPSSVTVSPGKTSRSTPCSAWPSPYQALRPRRDKSGSLILGPHIGYAHALVGADCCIVAGSEDAASLKHGDPVAKLGNDVEIVLDHEYGKVGSERTDDAGNDRNVLMPHPSHRLVEQEHLGVQRKRGGDLQHSFPAIRQVGGKLVVRIGQAHRLEKLQSPRRQRIENTRRTPELRSQTARALQGDPHIVQHGKMG